MNFGETYLVRIYRDGNSIMYINTPGNIVHAILFQKLSSLDQNTTQHDNIKSVDQRRHRYDKKSKNTTQQDNTKSIDQRRHRHDKKSNENVGGYTGLLYTM